MTRVSRPSAPPPAKPTLTKPAEQKKPLAHRFRDEMSTGRGLALRASFNPPERGSSSPLTSTQLHDAIALAKSEQLDSNDALAISRGIFPLSYPQLEELGIDPSRPLSEADRNRLVAEAFKQAPWVFLDPHYTQELSAENREKLAKSVADAIASGALSVADAVKAVDGLKPTGPALLINALMTTPGVPESVKARVAEEMWASGDPDQQAAAALYFTSSPELIERHLSGSGEQAWALTQLTRLVDSGALDELGTTVPGLWEQLHGQAVTGAFTLFENLKPSELRLLLNDEQKGRDLATLETFFEEVLFNPDSKEILEDHGYTSAEIQDGIVNTVGRFTDYAYDLGVTQGGEGFPGSSTGVGIMVGRLFGLFEKSAGDVIDDAAANQDGTFENFVKDVAVGALATAVGSLSANPALAAAGAITISAGGATITVDGSESREEIEAQIQEQLGAVRLTEGEDLFGAYAVVLGEVREETRDTPLDDPLDEYFDGIVVGNEETSD